MNYFKHLFLLLPISFIFGCGTMASTGDHVDTEKSVNSSRRSSKKMYTVSEIQSEFGEIRGRLMEENGEPVPFAIIKLMTTNSAGMFADTGLGAATDIDGYYVIKNVPTGSYTLHPNAIGFELSALISIEIEAGQLIEVEDIILREENIQIELLKPVIYLYPTEETDVTVRLNYQGTLSHTYPRYKQGWNVTASPDGTLLDENGRSYYALFWEGIPTKQLNAPNGFVVKGEETISFLETTLDQLGLTEREANEFIMFWLPQLENNAYNLIHFSEEEYLASAALNVSPAPETTIRIMMVYQPLNVPIDVPLQLLPERPKRSGFTLVEWGGSKIDQVL